MLLTLTISFFLRKVTQEAIATLEKDQDTSKALETLRQLQGLLCQYLAEPGSSSHPPVSVTQTQQSDLLTTPSLNPVTTMDSQRSLYDPYDTTPSYSDLPAELVPHLPIDVVSMVCFFLRFLLSMLRMLSSTRSSFPIRPSRPSSRTTFTNDLYSESCRYTY